jgi:hypothetical protein
MQQVERVGNSFTSANRPAPGPASRHRLPHSSATRPLSSVMAHMYASCISSQSTTRYATACRGAPRPRDSRLSEEPGRPSKILVPAAWKTASNEAWARMNCRHVGTDRRAPDQCRSTQDLPHGGRRYGDAELRQLTMDPAVPPQRILLCQANDQAADARRRRRAAGLALLARVVPTANELAVPGQERRWRHEKNAGPAPPRQEPCQRLQTTPGRPAPTVPGQHADAAPRSRVGARATRHPSPGLPRTPGRPGRARGPSAGKRS